MPTSYRPYTPNQSHLLPPSPKDWLPEGHLANFISDVVDDLDLKNFYDPYKGDGRRNRPFDPRMMVKIVLYGYAIGIRSSRKIARKLHEDVAFRVLASENFPAHRTISDFRQKHLKELEKAGYISEPKTSHYQANAKYLYLPNQIPNLPTQTPHPLLSWDRLFVNN